LQPPGSAVDIATSPLQFPFGFAPQGSAAPAFQPGEIIEALVLAVLDNETVRLSLPGLVLDAKTTVPLDPGSTVRLAVAQASGSTLQLTVVANAATPPQPVAQPAAEPAPSIAPQAPALQGSALPRSAPQVSAPQVSTPQASAARASASQASASQALAPQGSVSDAGVIGPLAQSAIADAVSLPGSSPPSPETASVSPAQTAPPLAQVVVEATQAAATRQAGLAPLLADLAQVVEGRAAPQPVLQAAQDVLNLRVPLDTGIAAGDIKEALAQSGLFLEARLSPPTDPVQPTEAATMSAQGTPQATPASSVSAGSTVSRPAPPAVPSSVASAAAFAELAPSGDLKAALLVLREVVKVWAENADPATPLRPAAEPAAPTSLAPPTPAGALRVSEGAAKTPPTSLSPAAVDLPPPPPGPPPPYRGDPPAAQPAAAPSLASDAAPHDVAEHLLTETDAALARHSLLQIGSLPDQTRGSGGSRSDSPQWLFEIPFLTRQGTSIAQFEIGRDGRALTADGRTIWRARFSLDVEPMGPVHVQVALLGERTAVTLWAEREASAARLRENTSMLSDGLRRAELEPGEIQCRVGAPSAPRSTPGRFLDRAS
jgi:hypothetical protein